MRLVRIVSISTQQDAVLLFLCVACTPIVDVGFRGLSAQVNSAKHGSLKSAPGASSMTKNASRIVADGSYAKHTLRTGLSVFVTTCIVGTVVYAYAGWGWLDAFYMVTITIFGVGYGEVRPVEPAWLKVFTTLFIFVGCSSLIYVVGGIVQLLAEGELQRIMGNRSRTKEIDQLSEHTIICGYGRVGRMLALDLAEQGQALVVMDSSPERVDDAVRDGHLAVEGDATDDHMLIRAGILQARTLATVLPNDAINVFITLSARDLSDTIQIIARAESATTERKLIRSGANDVVIPAAISANRIAQLAAGSEKEQLPENRYRMIQQASEQCDTLDLEAQICDDARELVDMSSQTNVTSAEDRMARMVGKPE